MWKTLRVSILLFVLAVVASGAWFDQRRVHKWREPLHVGIIPLAGDDSPVTRDYLARLDAREFAPIEVFFAEQARAYGLPLTDPVRVDLYPTGSVLPPPPPPPGHPLATVWWSLSIRYYAFRHGSLPGGPTPPIRLFVIYHDPALTPSVPHSAGLEKGMIGVANVFALQRMSGTNNVVIGHEFLHTLGATDKYDLATDAPLYPDGYGEPARTPRYPQRFAELMGGRIARSPSEQDVPESLVDCVLGRLTASEIKWVK